MRGPRELVILGSGGFARETAAAIGAINAERPAWRLRGFLDDRRSLHGTLVSGTPVLGPLDLIADLPAAAAVIATGRPDDYTSRLRIRRRLGIDPERWATIVHPAASVGAGCTVGAGSVLLAHVDATADVTIGEHVAVMPQSVLPHDSVAGDFSTLASGVRLGGATTLREGAYIGSGAVLREQIEVGDWAMVGMGSVVTRDVPARRLWHGAPARDAGPAPVPLDLEAAA